MCEDLAALEHLDNASLENLHRVLVGDVLAIEADLAFGHLAVLDGQQTRDRLQRRRFPRTVASQQSRDLAGLHFDVGAAQNLDDAVEDNIDVAQFQKHGRHMPHACPPAHHFGMSGTAIQSLLSGVILPSRTTCALTSSLPTGNGAVLSNLMSGNEPSSSASV